MPSIRKRQHRTPSRSSVRTPSPKPRHVTGTAPDADDLAREIRSILDNGPASGDTWPMVAAESERLADGIVQSWSINGRPEALGLGVEMDVVCSGGGWRNMYCGGAYSVLRVLERRGELVICRASGASSGALAAATIGCNSGGRLRQAKRAQSNSSNGADSGSIPCRDWYRLHDAWDVIYQRYGFGHYCPTLRGFIRAFYPADAHARCSASSTRFSVAAIFAADGPLRTDNASASASWLPWKWPRPVRRLLAEDFMDFADLESAILASSALPFIIGSPFFHYWRNYRCLDGGLVDNCPIFRDNVRPQLVVDLSAIPCSPPTEMLLLRSQATETRADQQASSTIAGVTSVERDLGCGRHRVMELWQAGMRDCARALIGEEISSSSSSSSSGGGGGSNDSCSVEHPDTDEVAPSTNGVPMRLLHGDGRKRRRKTLAACAADTGNGGPGIAAELLAAALSSCGSACAAIVGIAHLFKLIVQEIPSLLCFLLWLLKQKLLH